MYVYTCAHMYISHSGTAYYGKTLALVKYV